jgi:hypothetical protein
MSGLRLALILLPFFLAAAVRSGEPTSPAAPLPEGETGIAAKYPGDQGIERDPAVIFHDNFEACSRPADLRRKWDVVHHDRCLRIADEAANVRGGKKSLEFTVPRQEEELSNAVSKLLQEKRDVLFLRYYSKFEKGFDQTGSSHNGGHISAGYFRDGRATPGERADGRNKFLANFENWRGEARTPSPGHLNVYCYHPEQRDKWGDHFFPTGTILPNSSLKPGKATFGEQFIRRPDFVPELDRWFCFEFMVQANTVGRRDGRIACWVDGKLIADFPNLRLRDVETLKIDRFGLELHIGSNRSRENKKWYDDVVAASRYIGPFTVVRKGGTPAPAPPATTTPAAPARP